PKQVSENVKTERLAILQEELHRQNQRFAQNLLGQELEVLVEKPGRHPGQVVGKSPFLQAVFLQGQSDDIGKIVTVQIDAVEKNSLSGKRVGPLR
ncbi:MAG: TRAM domain-containing protein, partial [Alphaproteobacteria bacterium]